jgi:phage gp29-like protein
MVNKRRKSSQDIGKQNAKKIADWVNTSPIIPLYQGRVNKTQIFKMHNVPKSTLDTNEDLQKLFAPDGSIEKLVRKQKGLEIELPDDVEEESSAKANIENTVSNSELELKVKALETQLNSIQLDLASEEFLLATGRYIPKLYLDDGDVSCK